MSNELKLCPFCGSKPVLKKGCWYVRCEKCFAENPPHIWDGEAFAHETKNDAIETWNQRYEGCFSLAEMLKIQDVTSRVVLCEELKGMDNEDKLKILHGIYADAKEMCSKIGRMHLVKKAFDDFNA